MSEISRPDDVEEYHVTDAAPSAPVPRYAPASGAAPLAESRDGNEPVPDTPVHLCPWCDYDLRGLTSRRCPECGKPFTISEARHRGGDSTAEAQEDRRVLRIETIRFYVGLTMLLVGYTAPIAVSPTALRKWVMTMLVGTMLSIVICYKIFFQKGWHHALMIAGILSLGLGGLILVM